MLLVPVLLRPLVTLPPGLLMPMTLTLLQVTLTMLPTVRTLSLCFVNFVLSCVSCRWDAGQLGASDLWC
jgi:hypothetical protein